MRTTKESCVVQDCADMAGIRIEKADKDCMKCARSQRVKRRHFGSIAGGEVGQDAIAALMLD